MSYFNSEALKMKNQKEEDYMIAEMKKEPLKKVFDITHTDNIWRISQQRKIELEKEAEDKAHYKAKHQEFFNKVLKDNGLLEG